MNVSRFSRLKTFCSSYFHEDWVLEAENPEQVVSSYLASGWSSAELNELAGEMRQFARSYPDDAALERALFSELGCYYMPSADHISAREWLEHITSRVLGAAERGW
jgi:hypothetical protein